jgi:hypothetical protein
MEGILRKYKNFFERYNKKYFMLENNTLKYSKLSRRGVMKEINLKGAKIIVDKKSRRKFHIITFSGDSIRLKCEKA